MYKTEEGRAMLKLEEGNTHHKVVADAEVINNGYVIDRMKRIPVREQDPSVRATNFEEVCLGYNEEEALKEASRCLKCKNPKVCKGVQYQ